VGAPADRGREQRGPLPDAFEADPSRWGGVVAVGPEGQYDPCYHQPCDTYENINDHVLGIIPTPWRTRC